MVDESERRIVRKEIMRVQMSLPIIILVMIPLALTLSCKDDNPTGDEGSPSNVNFPTDSVSYAGHVQLLFNQTCALSGCHDDTQPADRVKLTSWGSLMIVGPLVVRIGQPDLSELVWRIEGRVGQRMPLGRNSLNQNQINGIRTWIAEGARNN
jgi:hypothetical protein